MIINRGQLCKCEERETETEKNKKKIVINIIDFEIIERQHRLLDHSEINTVFMSYTASH